VPAAGPPGGEGHALIEGPCRCTYIDVGLNDGRSVDMLLRANESRVLSRPPKGWGAKVLEGWQGCIADGFDCWYGFEGNPEYTRKLRRQELALRALGRRAQLYTETLFAVADGTAPFFLDNLTYGVGSTLRADKLWVRRREGKWKVGPETASDIYERVTVATVAAGPFLRRVRSRSAFVFLKLDVEGYEYDLIPHLLRSGELCGSVEVIGVDWHERSLSPNATRRKTASDLSKSLKRPACNIAMIPWA